MTPLFSSIFFCPKIYCSSPSFSFRSRWWICLPECISSRQISARTLTLTHSLAACYSEWKGLYQKNLLGIYLFLGNEIFWSNLHIFNELIILFTAPSSIHRSIYLSLSPSIHPSLHFYQLGWVLLMAVCFSAWNFTPIFIYLSSSSRTHFHGRKKTIRLLL